MVIASISEIISVEFPVWELQGQDRFIENISSNKKQLAIGDMV